MTKFTFKFRNWHFVLGLVLLFFTPISAEWRLLLFGSNAVGVIVPYDEEMDNDHFTIGYTDRYAVLFSDGTHLYHSPIYTSDKFFMGQKMRVKYYEYNPKINLTVDVFGIYRGWNLVFTLILIFIWFSTFWSINK